MCAARAGTRRRWFVVVGAIVERAKMVSVRSIRGFAEGPEQLCWRDGRAEVAAGAGMYGAENVWFAPG